MTLVLSNPANPNPPVPPASFATMFRSALLSECQATMERVCNDVMNALEAACSDAGGKGEVSMSETVHDYVGLRKECLLRGAEMQAHNSKASVIPRMMTLDMDFGGNLKADSVCARFGFNREIYHEYKKTALAIYRCYKGFGGELNMTQTCKTARICCQTFRNYVAIMKEGFNVR